MAAGRAASLRVKSETVIIPLAIIPAGGSAVEDCSLANPFFALAKTEKLFALPLKWWRWLAYNMEQRTMGGGVQSAILSC